MPTYEYACKQCGQHLEAVQAFSDPAITTCPNCGGELRKVFGAVGIVFKGSGFYKTDNRNGSSSGGAKQPAASDGASAPAEPPKSDSAPAATPSTTSTTSPAPASAAS
ncbi:MAG: FmdB family transcriptional regulator [Actinomycetota bacterium]|nr:FmdB family transcriptional regulator [Actinomycetota bacterium]